MKQKQHDHTRYHVQHTVGIYAAYKAGCLYFVTNNPNSFIRDSKKDRENIRRTKLEEVLKGMKIVTIDELESDLNKSTNANSSSP